MPWSKFSQLQDAVACESYSRRGWCAHRFRSPYFSLLSLAYAGKMSTVPLSTCCFGYRLKSGELTTKKLAILCEQLETSLGPGYKIRPEPITEGGVYFVDYPGKGADHYKSMRFEIRGYPYVSDTTLDEWKEGPERTLCRSVKGMLTKLKAFTERLCGHSESWTSYATALAT